jgi:FkbM family methyltransferase
MHMQATASRAASVLAKNPALFCRILLDKLNSRRPLPPLPARRHIGKVLFEYDLPDYRGTAPMYFGAYAPLVVGAMKRFLRPGGIFVDVGANIGYLSAVAASLVGANGQIHCFEPVPTYFARLQRFADLNPGYKIAANQCAVGEAFGQCPIFITREPGQSTLVRSYKCDPEIVATIDVPVERLDRYISGRKIDTISLIKIDAEGFELPILKGLAGYFEGSADRPPIICEIAPRAYPLLGRTVDELATFMRHYGYEPRDLLDGRAPVDLRTLSHVDDVIFVAGLR